MVTQRQVAARLTAIIADGADAGAQLDQIPLQGHVVIEPIVQRGMVAYPPEDFVVFEPIDAWIVDGILKMKSPAGALQDPWLVVNTGEDSTQSWQYRLDFTDVTAAGQQVRPEARYFQVPPGDGVYQLALAESVYARGVVTTQGLPGPEGPRSTEPGPRGDPGPPGAPGIFPRLDDGATAFSRVQMKAPQPSTVVLMGDSTGNDGDEWYSLFARALAERHPWLRVEYSPWLPDDHRYREPWIYQAGEDGPAPPITGGVIARDDFARTGELSGSKATSGQAWVGQTGVWTTDGQQATAVNATGLSRLPIGAQAGPLTMRATVVIDTSAPSSGMRQMQIHPRFASQSTNLYVHVTVSSAGLVSWGLFKRISGTATQVLASSQITGLTGMASVPVSVRVDGEAVTVTVAGSTRTASLTASDVTALSAATEVAIMANSAQTAGSGVRALEVEVPDTSPTDTRRVLRVFNASMAGSRLEYQRARLDTILAPKPDLVIINSGHNYTTGEVGPYLDAVRDIVTATRAYLPEVGVAVSSQNTVSPSLAYFANNMRRNAALRAEAHRQGWGYIGGTEAFLAKANDGAAGILPDGLHPNSTGSEWWRDAALHYVDGLTT